MKKVFTASVLTTCLSLVIATAWLLLNPTTVSAAFVTADCGNDLMVTCSAARCDCRDLIGCIGFDSQGNVVSQTHCIFPGGGGGGGGGIGIIAE
jgi:hypothetical protein